MSSTSAALKTSPGWPRWCRCVGLVVVWLLAAGAALAQAAVAAAPEPGSAARGRLLYETGRLDDGQAVLARRAGQPALPPHAAACVGCHRPSARGGTEGGVLVPPIAGDRLFAPGRLPAAAQRLRRQWQRHQVRSAYDDALFDRAMAQGLDPDGRTLGDAMPRYQLPGSALADLRAYLRQRGQDNVPGLVQGALHLASVFTPDAPPERRQAVRLALQRWARGMAFGATPVRWHAWELSGPADTWAAQLQAQADAQPVYAVLSGAGGAEWAPVERFCEVRRLPCLFPVLDHVAPAEARHWAMYLGGGVAAEARMLARFLAARAEGAGGAAGPVRRIFQWQADAAGEAAARALVQAANRLTPALPVLDGGAAEGDAPGRQDLVVLWLRSTQAQDWLARHPPGPAAPRVLLSAQLAPPQAVQVPEAWRSRVLWVSQRSDPVRHAGGAALSLAPWMAQLGLAAPAHPNDLADVHAATFFFGDALAQAQGQWQPEHLLERLEVALDRRPAGAGFFRLSLGPGQRVAAQGGHLLAFVPPAWQHLQPLPAWLSAED